MMDVSRNVTKTVASRSANWTVSIIRATAIPTGTSAHSKPLASSRGITTSLNKVGYGKESCISLNHSYKFRKRRFCNRGLLNVSNTETSSLSSQLAHRSHIFEASDSSVQDPWVLPKDSHRPKLPIRERLRRWQAENVDGTQNAHHEADNGKVGQVANLLTRPIEGDEVQETDDRYLFEKPPLSLFEADDLVYFGNERSLLLQGDLVELRSIESIRPELAIFVRNVNNRSQFYTMSGGWSHKPAQNAKFFVPHFVSPEELEPLLAYLHDAPVLLDTPNTLQDPGNSIPRSVGASLLQKMADFRQEADAVYRKHLDILDNAYDYLALPNQVRHLTLPMLTKELLKLPQSVKDEEIAPSTLYAVYRTIMNEGMGFTVQKFGNTRAWGQFELAPKKIIDSNNMVTRIIRSWQAHRVLSARDSKLNGRPKGQFMTEFEAFLARARRAIDISRKDRVPTMNGQVGPARVDTFDAHSSVKTIKHRFNASDLRYIQFLKCWVGWQTFSLSSTMNGIGSTILQAMGRYDEHDLDRSTGWQFLQEIGIISPWETRAPFELRLPGYAYCTDAVSASRNYTEPKDKLTELRKDWGDLPVYCIDDAGAHEIDDGVSVEATEIEGEHWVHVHVADPGSVFEPTSYQAARAEKSIQTVYLPDRVIPMLADNIVQEKLSLAPNRPTLTISARVNAKGEIVDHKITAGTIQKVVYLTPTTLGEVVGNKILDPEEVLTVGNSDILTSFNDGVMHRDLVCAGDLSTADKANLKILTSVAATRSTYTGLRGGIDLNINHPSVIAKIDKDLAIDPNTEDCTTIHVHSDPFISISISPVSNGPLVISPVTRLMTLAGEVAAKWCSARNIPIIYRVTQAVPDKPDPRAHFRTHVLPYVLRGEGAPDDVLVDYLHAQGAVLPSSTPGPHVALGVEAYAKCTSPLRRYGDLLVHWQIKAALLEEAQTGVSLVGSTREDYLPFSKADVDTFIPKLEATEKAHKAGEKEAKRSLALQAILRAWKFGEGQGRLKEDWELEIEFMRYGRAYGEVKGLGLRGSMDFPADMRHEEISIGDVFAVKIRDVNPYDMILVMKALRRIKTAGLVE